MPGLQDAAYYDADWRHDRAPAVEREGNGSVQGEQQGSGRIPEETAILNSCPSTPLT